MKIVIEKTNTIKSIEEWLRVAPPEGGQSQWVDGRSAKELARYMLSEEGKMPSDITKYIQSIGWKLNNCTCIPEMVTNFPKQFGTGGGRHHDVLFVSDDWIIGVEAKVSESFDVPIREWLAAGGANRKKRICESLKLITGKEFSEADSLPEEILNLRYQLISATVGTIIEARNEPHKVNNACLLVLEFRGNVRKEKKYGKNVETNAKDFENYLDFLNLSGNDISDKERKIRIDKSLTLWIKKIHINISSSKYSVIEE